MHMISSFNIFLYIIFLVGGQFPLPHVSLFRSTSCRRGVVDLTRSSAGAATQRKVIISKEFGNCLLTTAGIVLVAFLCFVLYFIYFSLFF